jgi:hypothetical protein
MADLKTVPTRASVDTFLRGITDERKRADCYLILKMMKKATHAEPKMWGTSTVGFGRYHFVDGSGRKGDWFITGFSPCKQNLTIYIMSGFDRFPELMKKLGRYSTGKGCLLINQLADVDTRVLGKLISQSVKSAARAQK